MHVHTYYKPRLKKKTFYNNMLLDHLWSCVLKLVSELYNYILVGIVFHRDAHENEKLLLKRSILGLGRVMKMRS